MGATQSVMRPERSSLDWTQRDTTTVQAKRHLAHDLLFAVASMTDAEIQAISLDVTANAAGATSITWAPGSATSVTVAGAPAAVNQSTAARAPSVGELRAAARSAAQHLDKLDLGSPTTENIRALSGAFGADLTGARPRVLEVTLTSGLAGKLARGELDELIPLAKAMGMSVEFMSLHNDTLRGYWGSCRTTTEYLRKIGCADVHDWKFEDLAGFCVLFVLAGYKAKSLGNYLAAWQHCAATDDYNLEAEDVDHLRKVIKALVKITDQGDRDYAFPWLYEFTYKFAASVAAKDGEPSLEDLRFLAGSALRGGTGARAGSSFGSQPGKFKITINDVSWSGNDHARVSVRIPPGKSDERWVHFEDDRTNPHCTYRLLRNWYEATEMHTRPSSDPFFPAIVEGTLDWSREETKEQFLSYARGVARFIELPSEWIARIRGHSWRAGFATDMLSRGIEKWKVQLIGGWKSDCVLLYARVTKATMARWTTACHDASTPSHLLPDVFHTPEFDERFARSSAVPEPEAAAAASAASTAEWTAPGIGVPLAIPLASLLPRGASASKQRQAPAFASLDAAVRS